MHTTYEKVFKGPLNTANSKNLYSFPKQQRFERTKQLECKKSYYDWKEPKTMRSTSFGFGKRSSLTSEQARPAPTQYEANSPSKLKKGFTFSNYKKVSFVDEASSNMLTNPGPGKYEKTFFEKSFSFSMRSKYEDPLHRHKNKLGPGQYKIVDNINKKGVYNVSSHKSSGCGKVGKEKRFGSDETVPPGPGKYKDQLAIDPVGNYFNSRIPSKGIRSFAGPNRDKLFLVGDNPGPGTYYIFPEFQSTYTSK